MAVVAKHAINQLEGPLALPLHGLVMIEFERQHISTDSGINELLRPTSEVRQIGDGPLGLEKSANPFDPEAESRMAVVFDFQRQAA